MDFRFALALALPIAIGLAAIGSGVGLGRAVGSAMEAIGRQPEDEPAVAEVVAACGHHAILASPALAGVVGPSGPATRRLHPATPSLVAVTPSASQRTANRTAEPSGLVTSTSRSPTPPPG